MFHAMGLERDADLVRRRTSRAAAVSETLSASGAP
jgi:hypothetical protein